jgi:hypothetical protein
MHFFIFYRPSDIPTDYMDGLDLYLWIFSIIIMAIGLFLFLKHAKDKEILESAKKLYESFAIFCVFMSINKIVFILAYLTAYYAEFLAIGYISAALSLVYMLYVMEKYIVQKTRFLFTIFSIIIAVFMSSVLFLPEELENIRNIGIFMGFTAPLLILLVWCIAAIRSGGLLRKKAIYTAFGFILSYIGYFLDSESVIRQRIIDDAVAPALFSAGLLMVFYFQLFFNKSKR